MVERSTDEAAMRGLPALPGSKSTISTNAGSRTQQLCDWAAGESWG
jgi:hypothetical protein